ncbi:hypothetical protein [Nocardia sp. NPDC052566]|uniref:hypothetical protein n=1 Tax=Nocardia sp. NPDC052566 TaxID=3364330 RepID=UPI0037CB71C6
MTTGDEESKELILRALDNMQKALFAHQARWFGLVLAFTGGGAAALLGGPSIPPRPRDPCADQRRRNDRPRPLCGRTVASHVEGVPDPPAASSHLT